MEGDERVGEAVGDWSDVCGEASDVREADEEVGERGCGG